MFPGGRPTRCPSWTGCRRGCWTRICGFREENEEASEYRVRVYDGSTGELLTDERVEKGETQWFGEYPSSVASLETAVAACRWGNTGDFERKTVSAAL